MFFLVFRDSSKYTLEDSSVLRYSRQEEGRTLSYREYMPSIWQVCDKSMLNGLASIFVDVYPSIQFTMYTRLNFSEFAFLQSFVTHRINLQGIGC